MIWETVIGLETHVELSTRTKIFCACSTRFGGAPNTQCCPVCAGLPGALPVLNEGVLTYAVKAALVLGCAITRRSRFDRKNYFYPDLPRAYQISQLYCPIARDGEVTFSLPAGGHRTIRIHELHMEDDAGKLLHNPETGRTSIDYNRCGVPLIEIVTEPDFRTGEEVTAYLETLKERLQYLGVSDCRMQEGSLRCDVNLSVRPQGSTALGTRTEMKNLSSFRAILRAIAFESQRQIALIEGGGQVVQETRRWDEDQNASLPMRTKENAQDYRYFPDPDLPPIVLSDGWLARLWAEMPELAEAKRDRYRAQFGLSEADCKTLTSQRALAELFEQTAALGTPPKQAANWLLGPVLAQCSAHGLEAKDMRITPQMLARLIALVQTGGLNRSTAIEVLAALFTTGGDVDAYVSEHGLNQVCDAELVGEAVERVFAANPKSITDYWAGKEKALGFLVGQTMRALHGRASPQAVQAAVRKKLRQN